MDAHAATSLIIVVVDKYGERMKLIIHPECQFDLALFDGEKQPSKDAVDYFKRGADYWAGDPTGILKDADEINLLNVYPYSRMNERQAREIADRAKKIAEGDDEAVDHARRMIHPKPKPKKPSIWDGARESFKMTTK